MLHREHGDRIERRRDPSVRLAELARSIVRTQPLWRSLIRHDPAQRGFIRLYGTDDVEAWVLTWSGEQAIELHDHGNSSGAVLIVDGSLTESFTDLSTRAPLRQLRWPAGSVRFFDAAHIHDLQNSGPGPATSIHVYSPPLDSMTFYDHRPETFLQPLRTEVVASHANVAHAIAI